MSVHQEGEKERRAYWTRQMDDAYDFMLAVQEYPLVECGEPLFPLAEAARDAKVKVLFSPTPHVRGLPRLFFLREGLLPDFIAAAREMNDRGWVLRIEDGYRTREMQKHLALKPEIFSLVLQKVRWELGEGEPSVDLFRRRLAAMVARSPRVGTHCSGSAIDVSVLSMKEGTEVNRDGSYLEVSEKTPMGSPFITEQAAANRAAITALMARHGFQTYPFEFWHYNKGDVFDEYLAGSGRPGRYGPVHFDPATGAVRPVADAATPLNSDEEIRQLMAQALQREGLAPGKV